MGLITGRRLSGVDLQLAVEAENRGDVDTAIVLYREVLGHDDGNALAHNGLGALYYRKGDIDGAARHFSRAVEIQPRLPRAWCNLGACHNERQRHREAIVCYERALAVDLRFADAYRNMGKAYADLGEHEMAVWSYRRSLDLRRDTDTVRGLAKAYRRTGRFHRARDLLAKAIEIEPDNADLHFNLALTRLHLQDYAAGLAAFEWRFGVREMKQHCEDYAAIFDRPRYQGEDLAGRTILLHTEQGFGDNIQFARFIPLVRERAARVVMHCRPGLGELFADSFDIDEISNDPKHPPPFDVHLPLLSVPHHFDPHLSTLRRFSPYLRTGTSSAVTPDPGRLNVGIAWGASDSGFDHRNKKVPLLALDPLLSNKAVKWFSLQVGSDRRDLNTYRYRDRVVDVGATLAHFAQTAAAIGSLDLVISCDTAVAHLAGALGKPVWLMLKKEPDWRWHPDGDRCDWYPSARLYRQYSRGVWDDVVRRLIHDLDAAVAAGTRETAAPR